MRDKKTFYLHVIIMLCIMFCGWIIPPFHASITPLGMRAIGIFFGVIYGWMMLDLLLPSLVGIFAVGWSGFYSVSGALSTAWGGNTTIQFAVFLMVIDYMNTSGMSDWMARWAINLKFAQKNVWNLILVIYYIGFFIACMTNGVLSNVVLWGFCSKIFEECGITKEDKLPTYFLSGLLITAMIGSSLFPWQTVPLAAMNGYLSITGQALDPAWFFACRFPCAFLFVFAVWAFMRWVIRPDVSKLQNGMNNVREVVTVRAIRVPELVGFVAVAVLLLGVCVPTFFPDSLLKSVLKALGATGIGSLIVIVFGILHYEGKPLMDIAATFRRLNWTLLAVVACTIPLCNFIEADECGIVAAITSVLGPTLNHLNVVVYCAFVVIFITLVTQVTHNVVLCAIMTPILIPISTMVGINPAVVTAMIISPCMTAVMMPAASANAAFIYGLTDWVDNKHMLKCNGMIVLMSIVFTLCFLPYYLFIS